MFDDHGCSGMTPSFKVMLGAVVVALQQQHCPHALHPMKCCFKEKPLVLFAPARVVDDMSPWL